MAGRDPIAATESAEHKGNAKVDGSQSQRPQNALPSRVVEA
jgi:hypothetical protein